MYECWAWIDVGGYEVYEWVQGFDVGTTVLPYRGHVTVFEPMADQLGYYVDDWQLHYGIEKPTHYPEDE